MPASATASKFTTRTKGMLEEKMREIGGRAHLRRTMRMLCLILSFQWLGLVHLCIGGSLRGHLCREEEMNALHQFKQGLYDPHNQLSSWVVDTDCCRWTGVICNNRTGYVFKLKLLPQVIYNGDDNVVSFKWPLGGEISPSLLGLKHLRYLDMSHNNFKGKTIPEFMGSLSRLRYLDMSFSNLYGRIPHQLGNLSRLEFLDISFNNLYVDDARWISCLFSLTSLQMDEVEFSQESNWLEALNMLPSIRIVTLTNCQFVNLPALSHVNFTSLQLLSLAFNNITSPLPKWLANITSLQFLSLQENNFNGPLLEGLGSLSALQGLYLNHNKLSGTVSHSHFSNLTSLVNLGMDSNDLVFNISDHWVAPFRLQYANMGSCKLGPCFPAWLKLQEEVFMLNLSDSGISDSLPEAYWSSTSSISILDLSNNEIKGQLPNSLLNINFEAVTLRSNHMEGHVPLLSIRGGYKQGGFLDASNNSFSGPIPENFSRIMSNLSFLSLSNNRFNGRIPSSICQLGGLQVLDLSTNHLSGDLPTCWNYLSRLVVLNLAHNGLVGAIPSSLGFPSSLQSLHMNNNSLSGKFPLALKNCSSLIILDLGENRLFGSIPSWMARSLTALRIIRLRSNKFTGNIPKNLSTLAHLHYMDLAHNKLTGSIPLNFGNFVSMKLLPNMTMLVDFFSNYTAKFGAIELKGYSEKVVIVTKGVLRDYGRLISLFKSIDLSCNKLYGNIPQGMANLTSLQSLNISGNNITGEIIQNIGALQLLESLDLSRNNLSGVIPPSMSDLTFLSHLNLSFNNFSGRIPTVKQFSTLNDPSSYIGNPYLCGVPLNKSCEGYHNKEPTSKFKGYEYGPEDKDYDKIWDWLGLALGFIVGFWSIWGPPLFRARWRYAYFNFIDRLFDRVNVLVRQV